MRELIWAAAVALAGVMPGYAQDYTTAAEVKPILDMTRDTWVALGEDGDNDILYFTHLLAWRCGLEKVFLSVNDGEEQVFDAEPCHEDRQQPNALDIEDHPIFLMFDLKLIDTVTVRLLYDDGSEDTQSYDRAEIQM